MLRLIIFSFSLFIVTISHGQQQAINAIKKGDAKALQLTFPDEVDISINDQGDLMSKADATKKMETFLAANKVISYTVSHTGKSPDNKSFFSIGNIKTGGKSIRAYIKYSVVNGIDVVRELRFNEE
jgi:hypothetical protein